MRGCFRDIKPTADTVCKTPRVSRSCTLHPCPLSLQVKPPLRIVSCIVRRPCLTALGSVTLAILLTVAGWAYLLRGIGGAGWELSDILPQQDYPVYNLTPRKEKGAKRNRQMAPFF